MERKLEFSIGGGLLWVRSVLDSGKKIQFEFSIWGGVCVCVMGKVRFGLWEEFQFGGGCSG